MRLKLCIPFLFLAGISYGLTYDSGGGGAGSDQGDILSGSTANAIVYTNGSNALTTNSALGFNGTALTYTSSATFATSSGNVGIGVASPAYKLDVNGTVQLSSNSVIDATAYAGQAVTAGSTSTLTWTEVTDRLSEFVTSSFTVVLPGFYEISAEAGASQTAGVGCLLIKKNGTTITNAESCVTGATALATVLDVQINRILNLVANDIIRIDASATTANTTFQKACLTIKRLP